jgi:hypothetical protein
MPDYSYDIPEKFYFGASTQTYIPLLAISAIILTIIFIFLLPRKYAVVPFLIAGILIPMNVNVVIFGFNFYSYRLLILAGLSRLIVRRERYPDTMNSLDKVIVYWIFAESIAYILVWRHVGAIINRAGYLFTVLGIYIFLRSVIRTREDIVLVIKVLAVVVVLVAPIMWYEHVTQRNPFAMLGAREFSSLRDARVRAQGPFAYSIIAGTFGAVLVPLFIGLWWYRPRSWFLSAIGIVSSMVMMITSSSSTPVISVPAGILALSMWPLRKKMRMVRRGIVATLIGLHLVMKAPVWFLISRVSEVLGGSGYHRAMLIDTFVRHFFDWFLIGTSDNPNWGYSMWDVDNAYVGAGITGGLLGFILFLAIFVYGYRMIGEARSAVEESLGEARLTWSIGSALFANSIAFFGIVYFDQSIIAWYALLVMISVVHTVALTEKHSQSEPETAVPIPAASYG